MTPEFARESVLMRGAVAKGTVAVVTPATLFLSLAFASITPDTVAGGQVMVGAFEITRSGDTSRAVTVGVRLTGRAPNPLVAGDVQGGLSDVTYTIPAGSTRLPLSISFAAQDLYDTDHLGRVQLHDPTNASLSGTGRFDFVLVHNKTTVVNPPPAYALIPDWTQRWAQHATPFGTVSQLALGVQLNAGTLITDDGSAVIVSKDIHSTPGSPVTPGVAPLAGWELAPALLPSGDPNRVDIRTRADVVSKLGAPLAAGKQYVIVNSINGGNVTVSVGGGGTAGNMAWVRGVTEGRDRTAYPVLSGFQFNWNASHVGWRCVTHDGWKDGGTGGGGSYVFDLLNGTGFSQWESNWFKNQYGGYGDALFHVAPNQSISDCLWAFNDYRADGSGRIGACFLRPDSTAAATAGHQQCARLRIYGNHTHGFMTGPGVVTGGGTGDAGRTKWIFWGDGPTQQGYTNVAEVDYNLFTEWNSIGCFAEEKYPGVHYHDNTFEHGTRADPDNIGRGADFPLGIKHRQGRTTLDATTSVDAATPTSIVERNLWVWKADVTYPALAYTTHNVRDGYAFWRNNWGVTLAPGQQPAAWGTQIEGHLTVNVLSDNVDWPAATKGDQPCGGKAQIGALYGTAQIGNGGQTFDPDSCRVAATTPATRADRNLHLSIVADRAGHPTDTTTAVPGADVSIVPHRLQAPDNGFAGTPEVGAAAWNAAAYSGGGGGGSGDLDISFDYTHLATPAATDGNGCASMLYCHVVGQGAYPADVSGWSSAQWGHASDVEYQPHANFFRFTFHTFNTPNPDLSNKCRLVYCVANVLTRPSSNEAEATFLWPVGTTFRCRARKQGNDFSFTQSTPGGTLVASQTWTDATAGGMNTGNLLWRFQPGRHAKIENLTVA